MRRVTKVRHEGRIRMTIKVNIGLDRKGLDDGRREGKKRTSTIPKRNVGL